MSATGHDTSGLTVPVASRSRQRSAVALEGNGQLQFDADVERATQASLETLRGGGPRQWGATPEARDATLAHLLRYVDTEAFGRCAFLAIAQECHPSS
eukprot:CAMPEP_0119419360 /NCGR_PEP_ID=MMETSP1335-20130426/20598_1 /TAXON_ID=259385 /ORGANISM="Chrysoculter rhomboideus, Strain RCC1486" /LENGTH=97 /DNA_ID=CAMNT_0007444663 /DNA_START=79 /DNA_END=373 /DNA_ORIENTATION=+